MSAVVEEGNTTASTAKMPKGIPYIIGNEAAERFSYYGMRAILVIFMTQYLMNSSGVLAPMAKSEAMAWYHMFGTAVYFFPVLGALLSDIFWGKYKTIMLLSVVYCFGHLALALDETSVGLAIGLGLIAIGSGGIKPAVSAHVGDQFGADNKSLIPRVFSYFYFAVNLGAMSSMLLTPVLLRDYGPWAAFGLPGILMAIATLMFWMGRNVYTSVPPAGWAKYKAELTSEDGKSAMSRLAVLYVFVAFFWALFEQSGSSWVLQAKMMDRHVNLGFIQFELLPSQVAAINPILVMVLIPIFTFGLYPLASKMFNVTPLKKITLGLFVAAAAFGIVAVAEQMLQDGQVVSILWQFWAYVVITAAEVMVSITVLEFSYTQAPNAMKSIIMALNMLSVSLGNFITGGVNFFIMNEDGSAKLEGAAYFWFFAILMLAGGVLFGIVAQFYKTKEFVQDHPEPVAIME